jgi:uncharacterized protein
MKITFDPDKRARTQEERGLDFADAAEVFDGVTWERVDDRQDYGEARFITVGLLRGELVAVVWTPRDDARRVISMRMANERERTRFRERFGES